MIRVRVAARPTYLASECRKLNNRKWSGCQSSFFAQILPDNGDHRVEIARHRNSRDGRHTHVAQGDWAIVDAVVVAEYWGNTGRTTQAVDAR